jgi:hypothetical protein
MSQPPRTALVEDDFVLQTVIDQFPAEDVVMVRLIGRLGGDNLAARQIVAGLLSVYDDVLVITLPTMETSLAFAADEMPFDRDGVIELLHGVGQTQFVIFDTPGASTCWQLNQHRDLQSKSIDSMRTSLMMGSVDSPHAQSVMT